MAKASRVAARQAVALEDVQATLAALVEEVKQLSKEVAELKAASLEKESSRASKK